MFQWRNALLTVKSAHTGATTRIPALLPFAIPPTSALVTRDVGTRQEIGRVRVGLCLFRNRLHNSDLREAPQTAIRQEPESCEE